jgi:hypothetical protein
MPWSAIGQLGRQCCLHSCHARTSPTQTAPHLPGAHSVHNHVDISSSVQAAVLEVASKWTAEYVVQITPDTRPRYHLPLTT